MVVDVVAALLLLLFFFFIWCSMWPMGHQMICAVFAVVAADAGITGVVVVTAAVVVVVGYYSF